MTFMSIASRSLSTEPARDRSHVRSPGTPLEIFTDGDRGFSSIMSIDSPKIRQNP